MTARSRRVLASILLVSSLPALGAPALAQRQPPPPEPPPPVASPAPPEAEPPVATNERPMRFVLTGGNVVIGTKIGEDAEFYTVQTASGPVRIRKSDIAFMDFNVQAGTTAPTMPMQPPQPVYAPPAYPPVSPPVAPYPARPRRPGRGLFIAGVIVFSVFYGLTALGGTIASTESPSALWLLIPVAGPLVFYAAGDADKDAFGILLVDSVAQAAGLVMWIMGRSIMDAAEEEGQVANPFRIADGVDLLPVTTAQAQGAVLSVDL